MTTPLDQVKRQAWVRMTAGLLLVLFGAQALLRVLFGVHLTVLPLALGIVLLAWWARRRNRLALIGGTMFVAMGVLGWLLPLGFVVPALLIGGGAYLVSGAADRTRKELTY